MRKKDKPDASGPRGRFDKVGIDGYRTAFLRAKLQIEEPVRPAGKIKAKPLKAAGEVGAWED
jgi:hypothetical protein